MGSIEKKTYGIKKELKVIIRNAAASDAEEIILINKSVITEKFFMLREPEEANYTAENAKREIGNHLNNDGSLFIIAEIGKKVVGYLEFKNGTLKRTAHSEIFSMFILKEWRGLGIGKLLIQSLLDWSEKNPLIEKVTLAVFSTNERAQILYRKFGFIEEGRCPKDMKLKDGTYLDSVLMYKFVK